MKRKAHLLTIPIFVIFISISLANMHTSEPEGKILTAKPDQEPSSNTQIKEEVNRGELLYENHCKTCHNKNIHSRGSNKVNSIRDIRQWVIRWSRNLNLDWQNSDIDLVTDYLNNEFYRYDLPSR